VGLDFAACDIFRRNGQQFEQRWEGYEWREGRRVAKEMWKTITSALAAGRSVPVSLLVASDAPQ
jgi:hypothetical protein